MSRKKDLKSKPKNGRYFPIRFSDAIRISKELKLEDVTGERLAIRMENIESEFKHGHLLVDIIPGEDIAVYSLPEKLSSSISARVLTIAFFELSQVSKCIRSTTSANYSIFCVYLRGISELAITRRKISMQKKKFRGESKFSNAFKSKKVNQSESILKVRQI